MQRNLFLFLSFALVAIFVAGLLAIATPSDALEAGVALDGSLARWKQMGGSADLGALAPPRVPATANAATVYRPALAELDRLDEADRKLLNLYTLRNRPNDVAAVATRLDAAVVIAHEATKLAECEWNRDFYRTGTLTLNDIDESSNLVRLAIVVAAHAADRAGMGDLESAIDDLSVMRRMAGHAAVHPHVTQAAMGLFIDIAAFEVFERVFRDRELPAGATLDLTAVRDYRAAMRRTFLTHGTACLLPLDEPYSAVPDSYEGWHRDLRRSWFLDAMCGYITALDEHDKTPVRTGTPPEGADYAIVFLPSPSVVVAVNIAATRNDMAAAAIKLRSHRATVGDYPDSWVVPVNPDTGIVLQYRRAGNGFVLSSDHGERLDWRWE